MPELVCDNDVGGRAHRSEHWRNRTLWEQLCYWVLCRQCRRRRCICARSSRRTPTDRATERARGKEKDGKIGREQITDRDLRHQNSGRDPAASSANGWLLRVWSGDKRYRRWSVDSVVCVAVGAVTVSFWHCVVHRELVNHRINDRPPKEWIAVAAIYSE